MVDGLRLCVTGIEKDVEQRRQQGKIHQPEYDKEEYIYDVLRYIVMIRPGKTEQAEENFHVLLWFDLQCDFEGSKVKVNSQ